MLFLSLSKRSPGKFPRHQRRIQTSRLRGAAAASRLTKTENAKPRNSKARQSRPVMPVETGKTHCVATLNFPEIRPQVKRKKRLSAVGCFAPISSLSGRVALQQQGEPHAEPSPCPPYPLIATLHKTSPKVPQFPARRHWRVPTPGLCTVAGWHNCGLGCLTLRIAVSRRDVPRDDSGPRTEGVR